LKLSSVILFRKEELVGKRELEMYKLEDAIKALLGNTPIMQIARRRKISKNCQEIQNPTGINPVGKTLDQK